MITYFVNNPVKVIVGVLLAALFGILGLYSMPTQLTPEVQIPTISIETRWPGASPQEVERQIVQEQEVQLKSVEGVVKMTSESMYGMGRIILEFNVGANMQEALLKVNTRLQQVPRYPENAREPILSTTNSGSRPIAWFILKPLTPAPEKIAEFQRENPDLKDALEPARKARNAGLRLRRLKDAAAIEPRVKPLLPPDLDVPEYRKFAEEFIEARFERVTGVADSEVLGGKEEEMQVIVDPVKLAARKLTIQDVDHALRGANLDTSAGDLWEGKRGYKVRTLGQFRSAEEVLGVVLARQDGQTVYISDVGEVKLGYKKPDGIVRQFGQTCIAVNCKRAVGANVIGVMKELRVATDELNRNLLRDRSLYLEQVYDETEYINSAIGNVEDSLVIGGILTIMTLLLFLRSFRSTFIISLAIPTSVIGTFLVMRALDRSLNVVSLAGIAFAVGMLIDNVVVVLENIFQHWERGKQPFVAAVDGASEVWGAVLSSTLTNVAVFLPVVFMKEEAGQLFRDIALAASTGVVLSIVVAFTLVPMLAARMLKPHPKQFVPKNIDPSLNGHVAPDVLEAEEKKRHGFFGWLLRPIDWFAGAFVRFVLRTNRFLQKSVLLRLAVVLGFTGASIILSYWMMPKTEYLPNGNQNLVFGILLPPPGYNLRQLTEMGSEIEEKMRPYWDLDDGDPRIKDLKYPPIKDFFFVCRGRQVFMGLKAVDESRAGEMVNLIREVSTGMPGTFGIGKQASLFEQGLTAGRTIDVEITGPELAKLTMLGGRVFGQVMQKIPGAQAIPAPSLDLSSPEIHVLSKREQAADNGLSESQIGYAVAAMIDGAYAGDYFKDGYKIDLTILSHRRAVEKTQDVEQVPLSTPKGELVPLGNVANVILRSGPEQINHRQRLRAITIQVVPPPNMALEDAMIIIDRDIVQAIRDDGSLEGGAYQINLAGTADKLRSTWKALEFNIYLALLITYLLMAALFESWLYPFVVIVSVPLGALGGFLGLWILNQFVLAPLDVLTMLGFIILIGSVVNNPILIVEQALILMRHYGMTESKAVLEAVRQRIRPIFMSTFTAILGLLPLVLFPGAGSELYRGIGAVLLGGLFVSTIVTLVVIPAVFTLTLEAKEAIFKVLHRQADIVQPEVKEVETKEEAPAAS